MKLIDLSQPIKSGMPVYPGDSEVKLEQSRKFNIDGYNNHSISTQMHIGTHLDGRMHMLEVDEYIGNKPLESFFGSGGIIHAENEELIRMKPGYLEIIREKEIILLNTGMAKRYGTEEYYLAHPVLDMDFCKYLAENKVKLVGFDLPSPDRYPFEVHKFLFKNNIMILENLTNLDKLSNTDEFEICAFPLKLEADSSMTRAVAIIR